MLISLFLGRIMGLFHKLCDISQFLTAEYLLGCYRVDNRATLPSDHSNKRELNGFHMSNEYSQFLFVSNETEMPHLWQVCINECNYTCTSGFNGSNTPFDEIETNVIE